LVYLFDRYELDEDDQSLARDGQRVPLEPRALAVLLLMVRSDGKLLRKEAILQAVWKNTIVEESSLTRAVALLRKQLGDDPRHPTFIETVPTLGYRFIAPVRTTAAPAPADAETPGDRMPRGDVEAPGDGTAAPGDGAAGGAAWPGGGAAGGAAAPGDEERGAAPGRARRRWSRYLLPLVGILLLVGVAMLVRVAIRQQAGSPGKRSLVLTEFVNSTGEPVFDNALRQGLVTQLEQSPLLNLVSERRIQALLRLMGQPPETPLTAALGRELCQRAGAAALLEGSISSLGGPYVLGLRATQCGTGEVLDAEQMQASGRQDVLRTLDLIAGRLRERLGESLTSVAALDTPLQEATTSSLEALQALGEANRVQNLNGSAAAIPLLQRAIALDPQFAIAHALLGRLYGDIGQESRSAESAAQAYQFRNRASERERFFITATYETQVTGNLEKAEEICETWGRVYPRDPGSLGFPAGLILRVFGRYDEAVADATLLVAAEPDFAMAYHLLAINDIALGRLEAARGALDRAAARHLDLPQYALDRHRLAFLEQDERARTRLTELAATQPATLEFVYAQEAATLAYFGRMNRSRDIAQQAVTLALQLGRKDAAARLEAASAIREALVGNAAAAARHANAALALSTGRDAVYGAAFALAMLGDSAGATRLADELLHRYPVDTAAQFHYLPALHALIAANAADPAKALDALKPNAPYELGSPPSFYSGLYGVMYPTFVRGRVYLAAQRGTEAAAEFRRIIAHPTLIASDPLGVVARLELARALAMSGDRGGAQAAYGEFFALWQAADADIPLLKAAQDEAARLARDAQAGG
jgi:DNA-binding winged helix-turn-helix (wHTH) protein/tetratricopeptide (TPR) repeat protein